MHPQPGDDRPFTVREGAALGLDRCLTLVPVLPPGAFFSHHTAAILWGLPVPSHHEMAGAPLHVSSCSGNELRRVGVTGHLLAAAPAHLLRGGLPLSAPIATWVDLRSTLSPIDLVILGDALTGPWSKIDGAHDLDPAVLVEAAATCRGRSSARARAAADLIRPGTRSPPRGRSLLRSREPGRRPRDASPQRRPATGCTSGQI